MSFLSRYSRSLRFVGRSNEYSFPPFSFAISNPFRAYKTDAGDLRGGDIIDLGDGKIYVIVKSTFHTWGRGGSFVNLELKDVRNGAKRLERYRTADSLERE
jgi:hypothetical protein